MAVAEVEVLVELVETQAEIMVETEVLELHHLLLAHL
jgi:hypothetical protein